MTTTVFESAAQFGLTPDEILRTVVMTFDHLPGDAKDQLTEELAGAFAAQLLEKQRRS